MMAALFLNVGHAVAAELTKAAPPAAVSDELTLIVVDDRELDAVYGKGYPVQLFRPEAAMPVILWDEGKRKGRIQEIRSNVVSSGHSNHQGMRLR